MDLRDALDRFLLQLEADGRSPHTIGQYARHVRLLATWSTVSGVDAITHEDLARFLSSPQARSRRGGGEKKAGSMNAMKTSLKCFFGYCEDAGFCARSPARLIRRARCGPPRPRALTGDERDRLKALLAKAEGRAAERDRMLVSLLLGTGLRVGSALALDVEDVDLEAGELLLPQSKGGREETALMPEQVRDELGAFIGDRTEGPVFLGQGGERLSIRQASRRFRLWLNTAGIKRVRGLHALRHSFAQALYRKTGDLLLVGQALHHRSTASTAIYARPDPERLRRAL